MTEKQYLKQLGERVRKLRKASGMTMEQLADKADLTRMHVYRIEKAKSEPSLIVLRRIAKILRVKLGDLVE